MDELWHRIHGSGIRNQGGESGEMDRHPEVTAQFTRPPRGQGKGWLAVEGGVESKGPRCVKHPCGGSIPTHTLDGVAQVTKQLKRTVGVSVMR